MKTSLRALNLVESAGIGATATFMPLFANMLTSSYILVGSIVAGYGLSQALSYTYFAKMYDSRGASHRLFLIRLGHLLCATAFFMHLLAFDVLSLAGGVIAEMLGIRAVLLFAFAVMLGSFAMSRTLKRETVEQKTQE